MLQKLLLILTALTVLAGNTSKAQSVYMAPSSNIFISAATIFSADSMVLIPSSAFTITGPNTEIKDAAVTHSTSNPYIKRVYHLLNTTAPFTGSIAVYYLDNELNGLAENTLTLNVHNGTAWNAFTTGVTRDGVNNVITTTGLTNLSLNELTLAGLSSPLPVVFTFFNASCNNGSVTLSWQTAQETNSKEFEIQNSLNGNSWAVSNTIPAAGNSTTLHNYNYTVVNASANSLYRIVENDWNGRKVISFVIRSSCASPELFAVYPNPLRTAAIVSIHLITAAALNLKLYNATGALVKMIHQDLPAGNNQIIVDMEGFTPGMYQLSAQWDHTTKTARIIKE